MNQEDIEQYRLLVKNHLDRLVPIFAKATVGDFSEDVDIPHEEDEFIPLYVGIQIMLEVIREQIEDLKREIVNRKKIEMKLTEQANELIFANTKTQEEKTKAEALVSSIGDGVVATDPRGIITYMNKPAELLIGWQLEEARNKSWIDIVQLEDEKGIPVAPEKRPLYMALNVGQVTSGKGFYKRKGETKFPVAFMVTPYILHDAITGSVSVFRDISREQEIDRQKSEFITLASHQLRTQPTIINWRSEMLLHGHAGAINNTQKEYIIDISRASHRMVELINSLLNVSRLDLNTYIIKSQDIDIHHLIQEIIINLQPHIVQKAIVINQTEATTIPHLVADSTLVSIILKNILLNAILYTRPHDDINIRLKVTENMLHIEISDHGYGIPLSQQPQLFTKMFRADNARRLHPDGNGLGLYIVKSILDTIGGAITYNSTENQGTTVTVTMPLAWSIKREGDKQLTG